MTNKTSFLAASLSGLLALVLGACTSEVTDGGLPDGGAAPIAFRMPEVTKSVVDDAETMKEFSVWGWHGNVPTNEFDDETVTYNGSTWDYEGTRYWIPEMYDFYAVHPTNIGATVTSNGVVSISNFDSAKNYDLMTAAALDRDGSTPAPVSLSFEHELSRVSVLISTTPGVSATVNSAALYGMAVTGDFSRDLKNETDASWTSLGTLVTLGNTPFKSSTGIKVPKGTAQQPVLADLLLIPQDAGDLNLDLDLTRQQGTDSEKIEKTLPLGDSTPRLVAGHHYRYVITIEVDAITFSNFTVDDWGETHTGGDINIGSGTGNNVNNNGN